MRSLHPRAERRGMHKSTRLRIKKEDVFVAWSGTPRDLSFLLPLVACPGFVWTVRSGRLRQRRRTKTSAACSHVDSVKQGRNDDPDKHRELAQCGSLFLTVVVRKRAHAAAPQTRQSVRKCISLRSRCTADPMIASVCKNHGAAGWGRQGQGSQAPSLPPPPSTLHPPWSKDFGHPAVSAPLPFPHHLASYAWWPPHPRHAPHLTHRRCEHLLGP